MPGPPQARQAWFRQPWFRRLWLGYWVVLFAATHSPKTGWPGWIPPPSDKTLHLVAYFLLAWGGWLLLSARSRTNRWRPIEWLGVVVTYGACDEMLQTLCNRYCSALDLLADAIGSAAAIGGIELFRRCRRPRSD